MVRGQIRSGPGVVEWSLPDDEVGDVRARMPFEEEDLDPDEARTTWCPVCIHRTVMRAVVTSSGRRYDLCDGCGLLLHVDHARGHVTAHRITMPRLPTDAGAAAAAHPEPDAEPPAAPAVDRPDPSGHAARPRGKARVRAGAPAPPGKRVRTGAHRRTRRPGARRP